MKKNEQPQRAQSQFEISFKAIVDYAKKQMDEPDKDGYVIAPDSVLRGHHRNMKLHHYDIVKAVSMHRELIESLTELLIRADEQNTIAKNSAMSRAKQLLKQAEQK